LSYEQFFLELERESLKVVAALNKAETIRFISHLDADGLCSAAILAKLLLKYNRAFHLSIVKQLDSATIEALKKENYNTYLFTDIGSGQLSAIESLLEKGNVIVIDHHPPDKEVEHPNLVHINPHKYNIDGGSEISASTLSYFLTKLFGLPNSEHLAVIGTIGDTQEEEGQLAGINGIILKEKSANVEVRKGLRAFGRASKPIHKTLAYSTEHHIPGVSGDESSAIQFLSEIGLEIKNGDKFRSINDLSEEEEKKLITGIIMRRIDSTDNPEKIVGDSYIIKNQDGTLSDAHEFATLLNSCGRQATQSIGLMLCLGDKNAVKASNELIASYRRKITKALRWFDSKKDDPSVIVQTERAVYIKGKKEIDDTMIGTICSIKASSDDFKKDVIIGFADSDNGVKVSGRVASDFDFNMGEAIKLVSGRFNGEGGGHEKAAGGKIPFGSEDLFIAEFEKQLKI
jgi:RecJ-like exonuclease